jgi:DNA-binding transcriptional ArsR family regulator
MTASKASLFHKDLARAARVAKALSHPVRIRILQILAEKDACICGDIVDRLPLAQSTVSQHLKELKEAGLILGEIEGPRTCYGLNSRVVERAKEAFSRLFSGICCNIQGKENTIDGQRKAQGHCQGKIRTNRPKGG